MTEIDDFLERVKRRKRIFVKNDLFGRNMPPTMEFHREGNPIAILVAKEVKRDEGLKLAAFGASAFRADALYFAVDAYETHRDVVDEPFDLKPGELQKRWNANDRSNITESIMTMVVKRGEPVMSGKSAPYSIVRRGKATKLRWDAPTTPRDAAMSGLVPDVLQDAIDSPNLDEKLKSYFAVDSVAWHDGNVEQAEAHMDAIAATFVHDRALLVGLFGRNDQLVRRRVLTEVVGRDYEIEIL